MELAFGGRRVAVTAEDLIIGSDPDANLVVDGLGVLPRHALVRMRADGGVEVRSADPGSFLLHNGARVGSKPQVMAVGDRLVIGDQEIVALAPGAAAGAAERLNVTMMGMPAVVPGSFPPPPPPQAAQPGRSIAPPRLLIGVIVVAIVAYFFLFQG